MSNWNIGNLRMFYEYRCRLFRYTSVAFHGITFLFWVNRVILMYRIKQNQREPPLFFIVQIEAHLFLHMSILNCRCIQQLFCSQRRNASNNYSGKYIILIRV